MKFRNTVALFIVALCIGSFIWFYERNQSATRETGETGSKLFGVRADDIDLIEIAAEGGKIVCAKDGEGVWRLEAPVHYRADASQIKSICSRFESLSSQRIIPAGEINKKKLEEYGLKKPRITARFRAREKKHEILIGGDPPMGSGVYALVDEKDDVHMLPQRIYAVLNKKPADLRDTTVVEFDSDRLARAEVLRGKDSVELSQKEGTWRITKPIEGLGSPDTISGMLRRLKNLRVHEFISDAPDDLGEYGLDEPDYEVVLWDGKDQSSQSVLFGKSAGKNTIFAKNKGLETVFTVNDRILKDLALSPEEFRDRKLTHLADGAIESVKIEKGDNRVVLSKSGKGWKIEEPEKGEADESRVRSLLRALTSLEADEFIAESADDPAKYGFEEGALTVTLTPGDGEAQNMLIGKQFHRDQRVYVKRGGTDEVMAVKADLVKDISPDPLRYRKSQVLDFDSNEVTQLSVTRKGKPKSVYEKRGDQEWATIEPAGEEAKGGAIASVIANLSRLRAEEFVDSKAVNLKQYGLDEPAFELSVVIAEGGKTETETLRVGKQSRDGAFYAMRGDDDSIFTIPAHAEKNLSVSLSTKKGKSAED